MEPDNQARPPEAVLIKRARAAAGMTVEAAAAAVRAAGGQISTSYWGDVERGQGGRRSRRVPVRASARTLAQMARIFGITPDRLAGEGQRPDAAEILDEILRSEESGQPASQDGSRQPAHMKFLDQVDEGALAPFLAAVEAQVRAATPADGRRPSGAQAFPGAPQEAELWETRHISDADKPRAIAMLRLIAAGDTAVRRAT